MNINKLSISLIAVFIFVASGCSKKSIDSDQVIVVIGNENIKYSDFETFKDKEQSDLSSAAEIFERFLEWRIILNEAKKANISVNENEISKAMESVYSSNENSKEEKVNPKDMRETIKEQLLAEKLIKKKIQDEVKISDTELRKYFNDNVNNKSASNSIHLAQILVKDIKQAGDIKESLLNKTETFENAVKKYSIGHEASKNGDLGIFRNDNIPDLFENAVKNLKEGELSEIVKTNYGFHIIKVVEKNISKDKYYEKEKENIRKRLLNEKKEEKVREWIRGKMKEIKINKVFMEEIKYAD